MSPRPLRFGPPGRQLLGLHHAPAAADATHGVLLCNPFGQEAIRCHRLLKVLADRLTRAGLHVLRFDYYATGDSDGDDAEAAFETWIDDVQRAREALEQAAGVRSTSWFGLRLGATLAMLASTRGRGGPERLVLWDPVVSGPAYLEELARAHASSLEAKLERPAVHAGEGTEALGFPLRDPLVQPLRGLQAPSFAATRAGRVRIVASPMATHTEALEGVLRKGPARVEVTPIASRIVWASDEAMNSAIVPADGLQAVVDGFTEPA